MKKKNGGKMASVLVHLTFPINLRGTSVLLAAERDRLFGNNADYVMRSVYVTEGPMDTMH